MEIPEINKRIKHVIEYYANGNVKKFSESVNIAQQSLNRLFNVDTRTHKYPLVTTEILTAITEMYVDINSSWLLNGKGEMLNQPQVASSPPGGDSETIKHLINKITEQAEEIGALKAEIRTLKKEHENLSAFPETRMAAEPQLKYEK